MLKNPWSGDAADLKILESEGCCCAVAFHGAMLHFQAEICQTRSKIAESVRFRLRLSISNP